MHWRDDCAAAPGQDGRAGHAAGEPQARQLWLERARALVVTGSAQPVYRAWLQGGRAMANQMNFYLYTRHMEFVSIPRKEDVVQCKPVQ